MGAVDSKKTIRRASLECRTALPDSFRLEAGRIIASRLDDLGRRLGWRLISCYVGFGAEVPTEDYIIASLARGLRVAVPYIFREDRRLYFSEIKDFNEELTVNPYGIREPKRPFLRILPVGAFDAIIVPGCAFDAAGHRLGYGLGFYDRLLLEARGRIPLIGLAFESQLRDELPVEEHDVSMDMVVTEESVRLSPGEKPAALVNANIREVV